MNNSSEIIHHTLVLNSIKRTIIKFKLRPHSLCYLDSKVEKTHRLAHKKNNSNQKKIFFKNTNKRKWKRQASRVRQLS